MEKNTIQLRNGPRMPLIGLGTYKIQGNEVILETLKTALESGYRSIDTAAVYRNECDIGTSLKLVLPQLDLTREDIFITSKLAPKDQGQGKCREACLKSLSNLQTDYLDLYLIHWPGVQGIKPDDPRNCQLRLQSWQDLEHLHKEGKIRAIGVSNFEERHLHELLCHCEVKPDVLQIEHHPHLVQSQLLRFCTENSIHFQAYSSLGTSSENNQLLRDAEVVRIADYLGKSPAQVLLRWAIQQGIGVLPKSTNQEHIKENIDIFGFCINDKDMEALNNLSRGSHYCWDPHHIT
ncbi:hypothetical protein CHS0354_031510 [Potamilus streckersoni]|uniref:NADP-dependent oxidoreductase domain-containing protein n=1 Tax=Potamilus streckersoni TaxID=2493646 RepID=A0AAE0VVA7_9BIVA|nr:hypothetical protein CHS0354_031510 [Potamilus streckersoni]